MVSVIISSRDPIQLDGVKKNIRKTIGTAYEIIAIENSRGLIGICKAYNEGILKAKFDLVCFTHEDVFFESENWGQKVANHLADPAVGLIGLAGGDTKGKVPSSWSSQTFPSEISIVQHFKAKDKCEERIVRTGYPEMTGFAKPVICLDGVWMCTRKDVLEHFKFDEKTFNGFHGYDIDFSLQVSTRFRVMVVFDIVLHHFSEGSFNYDWLLTTFKVSEKWKRMLPLSVRDLDDREFLHQHWTSIRSLVVKSRELNLGWLFELRVLLRYSFTKFFHFRHFLHFLKVILLRQRIKNY